MAEEPPKKSDLTDDHLVNGMKDKAGKMLETMNDREIAGLERAMELESPTYRARMEARKAAAQAKPPGQTLPDK